MKRLAAVAMLSALVLPANAPTDALELAINRFARDYNAFIAQMNEGKFDMRAAKRLSADWRDIEQSGSWPKVK